MDFSLAVSIMPDLLRGAMRTLSLTALSTVFGFFLVALPLGLARRSRHGSLRRISHAYDFVFRGIPFIVLLYIVYFGLSTVWLIRETFLWQFFRDPYNCALLALSLNTGAYGAEIVQGAVGAVDSGLREAGLALGLKRWQVLILIELPIAVRVALAPYLHEIIQLTKSTAVASTITILDLMGTANQIYADTLDVFTPYLTAGAVYLIIILFYTWVGNRISRRSLRLKGRAA
jgi:putative lysine/arginine/ornithine/histidine/octopine transport system permease protein